MTVESPVGSARRSFAGELRQHMEGWSGYKHPDPPCWAHWTGGINEPYRAVARENAR